MDSTAKEFIERVSLHVEEHGLSRIAGRLIGFFLISGELHSLGELAERLQVSKGSVSTNARLLERRGLLERRCRPGDRRDFYGLSEDPWQSMFELSRSRMRRLSDLFQEGAQALPSELEGARRRLGAWGDFYAFVLGDIDRRVERWEAHRGETATE